MPLSQKTRRDFWRQKRKKVEFIYFDSYQITCVCSLRCPRRWWDLCIICTAQIVQKYHRRRGFRGSEQTGDKTNKRRLKNEQYNLIFPLRPKCDQTNPQCASNKSSNTYSAAQCCEFNSEKFINFYKSLPWNLDSNFPRSVCLKQTEAATLWTSAFKYFFIKKSENKRAQWNFFIAKTKKMANSVQNRNEAEWNKSTSTEDVKLLVLNEEVHRPMTLLFFNREKSRHQKSDEQFPDGEQTVWFTRGRNKSLLCSPCGDGVHVPDCNSKLWAKSTRYVYYQSKDALYQNTEPGGNRS